MPDMDCAKCSETSVHRSESAFEQISQKKVGKLNNISESRNENESATENNDCVRSEISNVESARISQNLCPKSAINKSMDNSRNFSNNDLECDRETGNLSTDSTSALACSISKKNPNNCIVSKHDQLAKHRSARPEGSVTTNESLSKNVLDTNHRATKSPPNDNKNVQLIVAESPGRLTNSNDLADGIIDDACALDDSTDREVAALINHVNSLNKSRLEDRISPQSQSSQSVVSKSTASKSDVVPYLRSALKKPQNGSATDPSLSSSKTVRSVSFNQTVIVFCEEIETSSPSDHCDPPAGYQDSHNQSEGIAVSDKPSSDLSSTWSKDHKSSVSSHHGHVRNDLDLISRLVGEDASKLTDEQLFGLLENASLLDDFQLDTDDYSDEDEFTIGTSNSSQGYLCRNAISDSDDSELSTTFRTNKLSAHPSAPTTLAEKVANDPKSDRAATRDNSFTDGRSSTVDQQIAPPAQKSLPARLRVSTVESVGAKKRPTHARRDDSSCDFKLAQSQFESTCLAERDKLLHDTSEIVDRDTTHSTMSEKANTEPMLTSKLSSVKNNIFQSAAQQINLGTTDSDSKTALNVKNSSSPPSSSTTTTATTIARISNCRVDRLDSNRQQRQPHVDLQESRSLRTSAQYMTHDPSNVQLKAAQANQIQPACHVCRAIETNQNQSMPVHSHNLKSVDSISDNVNVSSPPRPRANIQQQTGLLQQAPIRLSMPDQSNSIQTSTRSTNDAPSPPNHQPACISCCEIGASQEMQQKQQSITGIIHGQPRPIACKIVFVIDQNGNRIRALQLVEPRFNQPNIMQNAEQRHIILAPPGNCPPTRGTSIAQLSNNQMAQSINLNSMPGTSHLNSAQHAMLIRPPSQATHLTDTNNCASNFGRIASNVSVPVQPSQRNHTVYCVRQPLGAQSIFQSLDTTDAAKHFPDPHEVRRLDGLRAPASNINLTQRIYHQTTQDENKQNRMFASQAPIKKDDTDDPSFGFSNRPAVKVFQSGNSDDRKGFKGCRSNPLANIIANTSIMLPSSQSVSDGSMRRGQDSFSSQTLDRRGNIRSQNARVDVSRENMIPSTSSMSDINRSALEKHDKSNSKSTKEGISEQANKIILDNNSRLTKVYGDRNNGLPNISCQIIPMIDRQSHLDTSIPDDMLSSQYERGQSSLKRQEKTEVSYTMNI